MSKRLHNPESERTRLCARNPRDISLSPQPGDPLKRLFNGLLPASRFGLQHENWAAGLEERLELALDPTSRFFPDFSGKIFSPPGQIDKDFPEVFLVFHDVFEVPEIGPFEITSCDLAQRSFDFR